VGQGGGSSLGDSQHAVLVVAFDGQAVVGRPFRQPVLWRERLGPRFLVAVAVAIAFGWDLGVISGRKNPGRAVPRRGSQTIKPAP
jgi:hypothetical protein